ncbi:hypothetical protein ACQHIV_24230 [Kribbella sp. GL6]|uniref:hypothetical protein n=1 Tax=Kribbella sp. GL6 TaxID=3419765 RepID=UPI003D00B300
MSQIAKYWLRDSGGPYATFLAVVDTYYHPEVRNENFDALVHRARANRPDDTQMMTFKTEFVQLLESDRQGLHPDAISTAAQYDEWDDDGEFLAWLWHELYPSEPVPGTSPTP